MSVVQISDGSYAVAGYTNSSGVGGYDAWLVITESTGYMLWNQTYNLKAASPNALIQTEDGGYVVAACGSTFNAATGGNGEPFCLIKTDNTGNLQWRKIYQGPGFNNLPYSLIQTSDGGFALAGLTGTLRVTNVVEYMGDFWLVETAGDGEVTGLSMKFE